MYDIHCHILPGIDDGSAYIDETVEMAKLAVSGRTDGIICTPHDSPPEPYPVDIIFKLIAQVENILAKQAINLKLFSGQEIFLTEQALDALLREQLLTLNRTSYALVEFSPSEDPERAFSKLGRLRAGGLVPVVAHPERYAFIRSDINSAIHIKSLGCFLQVNKGSLKGAFGRDAAKTAHKLLDMRLADFVASDAHSPYMRTPYLGETREMICELYSESYADHLLTDNPSRIIKNQRLYAY